jgi:hypothetical protein
MTTARADKLRELMRRGEVESQYWRDNYNRLLAEYPEQFVAVLDGEVVAVSSELEELMRILQQNGIDPLVALVEFLTDDRDKLIL